MEEKIRVLIPTEIPRIDESVDIICNGKKIKFQK